MNVIGLDLSLTATGCCGYRPDAYRPVCSTITTNGLTGYARLRTILSNIAGAVDTYRPDLVVIEDLPSHQGRMSGQDLCAMAELHGIVKFYLAPRVPYVLVNTVHLRIYAIGKARAKKDEPAVTKTTVTLEVSRRYSGLVTVADDNQSDSLVLAAMALHHYGRPLIDVPASHARALTSVTWPDLPAPKSPLSAAATLSGASRVTPAADGGATATRGILP